MTKMEFPLSPHVKAILCGRGMCDNGRLLCSASNCLYHLKDSPDPKYGRDIEVKGYIICPRCGARTNWNEKEWNDREQRAIIKCMACNKSVPTNKVIWTQKVISKHRSRSHQYFHKECWEAMFIDVNGDE